MQSLLADASALFPVFPRPYLSLLGSVTANSSTASDSLHGLKTATMFFDAEIKASALQLHGRNVLVRDERHAAYVDMLDKVLSPCTAL